MVSSILTMLHAISFLHQTEMHLAIASIWLFNYIYQ